MELKPGYKQTDIGIIPEDWEVDTVLSTTPLNRKNGIVDGPFGSNLKTIHYKKSGIPIITSGYVTDGVFLATDYLYVDAEKFDQEKRSAVRAGDIVMAKIGARCGASAILPDWHETGILSGNALKITVDNTRHSTYYIWQVLWNLYSNGNIEPLRTVGAQPAISMANLKKYKIPLPPLPEQHVIATALSDVDALITALDRLIAKKRDIKQAAMQELLTGKRRLPGFSGEWKTVRLGEITEIDVDNLNSNTSPEYTFRYIALEDVDQGVLTGYSELVFRFAPSRARRKVRRNDILVSTVRPNLKSHLLIRDDTPDLVCSTGFSVLRCKPSLAVPDYVYFHLFGAHIGRQIETLLTGSNYPAINGSDVRALQIPLPPLSEQRAIAEVLSDMDAEIAALERKRDKTRLLKQGMMQELLTGRIRLV